MKLNYTEGLKIYGNVERLYSQMLEQFIDYTLLQALNDLEKAINDLNRKEIINILKNIKGGSK